MTRTHSFAIFLGLTLAAVAGVTSLARAGLVSTIHPPFDGNVCQQPDDVIDSLDDPNFIYAPHPDCRALCKKAVSDCKQYVRDAFSCNNALLSDAIPYAKKNCDVESKVPAICKKSIDVSIERDFLRSQRDSALADCDDWGTTCEATCEFPG